MPVAVLGFWNGEAACKFFFTFSVSVYCKSIAKKVHAKVNRELIRIREHLLITHGPKEK
jgi:hypothetical protein